MLNTCLVATSSCLSRLASASGAGLARRGVSMTSSCNVAATDKERQVTSSTEPARNGTVSLAFKAYESKSQSQKSPLVIHHSLLGSKANWKKVAKEINHLTRRTVVVVDARNHGDSPHADEMSYNLMAKDMRQLLTHLNVEKVSFMGHTMGGRVGLILALTEPQLVDKLVCVDTTPINTQISLDRWQTLTDACRLLKDMELKLRQEQGIARSMLADKAIQKILPDNRDRSLFLQNLIRENVDSHGERGLWRLNIDAFLSNPNMTASFPSFQDVAFEGKALFIAGEQSKFVKKEHEPDIKRLVPKAQFVWVPNCGHWIQTDKHEEFMAAVVPFLEA